MEFFKFFLFGITGLSLIFWVCVIAMWHTYTLPSLFPEENINSPITALNSTYRSDNQFPGEGKSEIMPLVKSKTIQNRSKYSGRLFVIADFTPLEKGYSTNRLYTLVLISVGVASFLFIIYGLSSSFALAGIAL